MSIQNFFLESETSWVDLGNGIKRKIRAYDDNLMCVEMHFEKGAVGALHSHPHEQITCIMSGEFEFTVGNETKILKKGDSTFKQPNIPHGAVCLEAGVLLDIFTPQRDDFLD